MEEVKVREDVPTKRMRVNYNSMRFLVKFRPRGKTMIKAPMMNKTPRHSGLRERNHLRASLPLYSKQRSNQHKIRLYIKEPLEPVATT